MKKGKLSVNKGAKNPKGSWPKAVKDCPKGSSAPGPHWGHKGMIPKKANIKGQ